MKKYLMTGMAAVALCAAFTSCSKDENVYDEKAVANQVVLKYNQAFIKTFGQPAADQDWGFGASNETRAGEVIKKDMTNYPASEAPADITDYEREYVTTWFQNNPGLSDEGLDISDFFIQWVSGDFYNKKGMWHRYDQNRINNGYASNYWDEEFTDNAVMDYLVVGASETDNVHVNDFNSNSGGPWSIVYIKGGSALQFGYHSSWDSSDRFFFKVKEIDVPGVGVGYYVGLSVYGKKYDNGDKELGIQRLQYAEDWILKVVPGKTSKIRVYCEDLSASDASDFDFNDCVFDAEYVSSNQAKITLWAAGGVLPLRINSTNGVGGFEVHEALGLPLGPNKEDSVMINTHAKDWAEKTGFGWADNVTKYQTVITVNGTFDINSFPAGVRDLIRVEVLKEGQWMELTAAKGIPACKIAGPVDDTVGHKWLRERKGITSGYPDFANYVGTGYPVNWWSNSNDGNLYGINGYSTTCNICTGE